MMKKDGREHLNSLDFLHLKELRQIRDNFENLNVISVNSLHGETLQYLFDSQNFFLKCLQLWILLD